MADVLRFLRNGKTPMTAEERQLIEGFRSLPANTRRALLRDLILSQAEQLKEHPEPGRS
jgi:hypothetical protein